MMNDKQESFYLNVSDKTFNTIDEIKTIAKQYFDKNIKTEIINRYDTTFSGFSLIDFKLIIRSEKTETYTFYTDENGKYRIL